MTRRDAAVALVRLATGLMFFLYGLGKLQGGVTPFAAGMLEAFDGTWVPPVVVRIFSSALPLLEATVGAGLILGLYTTLSLGTAAGLMLALLAGTVVLGDTTAVAHNVLLVSVIAALLAQREHRPALDRLLPRSRWR